MTDFALIHGASPGEYPGTTMLTERVAAIGITQTEPVLISTDSQAIAFTGLGSYSEIPLSSTEDINELLGRLGKVSWSSLMSGLRGAMNFAVIDRKTNEIAILADPLGAGFVYLYEYENQTFIATSIKLIQQLLESKSKRLSKSLDYTVLAMLFGNGGLLPASYNDVQVLPQHSWIEVLNSRVTVHTSPWPDLGLRSYSECLESIADDLLSNAVAASRMKREVRVAHLTGGFDSRLVLAALMKARIQDSFAFTCFGPSETPDRQVFNGLVNEFRLTATRHPGHDTIQPYSSRAEHDFHSLDVVDGMLPNSTSHTMHMPLGGGLIVSGGFGEFIRQVGSPQLEPTRGSNVSRMELKKLHGSLIFGDEGQSLVSNDFRSRITHLLRSEISHVQQLIGAHSDSLTNLIQVRVRNRYFAGLTSWFVAKKVGRYDPLYSPHAILLAHRLEYADRTSNILGFDLMDLLKPSLKSLPFDTNRITQHYEARRGAVQKRNFRSQEEPVWDGRRARSSQSKFSETISPTPEQTAFANSISATPSQVALYEHSQAGLKKLLGSGLDKEIYQVVDKRVLNRLIAKMPNNRVHIRVVNNLYKQLNWHFN